MRPPSFWWRDGSVAAALLAPLASIYGTVAGRRMGLQGRDAGIPVICIGNLTVGGAGKTPTALAVATMLLAAGQRPFFLTRGYGGRLAGPLRVDPSGHCAADVGDEPLLLAAVAPTIVARDRVAGAEAAHAAGASVIVMDDGFQNPSLAKDLAILVVDGRRGIGNAYVLPAGPLRAPLEAQLARAHALIVVGDGNGAAPVVMRAAAAGLAIFHGRLMPEQTAAAALAGRRVLAFAGIGDPEKFFATLSAAGADVVVTQSFGDHHRYTAHEAAALLSEAESRGLMLVTTAKDRARMSGDPTLSALARQAQVLPVALAVDEQSRFRNAVLSATTTNR